MEKIVSYKVIISKKLFTNFYSEFKRAILSYLYLITFTYIAISSAISTMGAAVA